MIKMAIKNKSRAPRYAYIAPYRNQAKMIAWEYLKFYTHVIPKIRVNESDLYVEMPCRRDYEGAAGARLYIVGADHPDALRGGYWDGVILDEDAADARVGGGGVEAAPREFQRAPHPAGIVVHGG